jgi:hypothetical protein
MAFAWVCFADDLEEGITAYKRKDYPGALRILKPLVEQEVAEACYYLGKMYYNGYGVQKDLSEALNWFRKGANLMDPRAQYTLGMIYAVGEGVQQDDTEAVSWFRKAAEQGDAVGQYYLGRSYYQGSGIEQDYEQAVKWTQKSADQGLAMAQSSLGWLYRQGLGVPQDHHQAVRWFRMAAEQGDAFGQLNLGWAYADGQGISQNKSEAINWLFKAGVSFLRDGNREQARVVLSNINELDTGHFLAEKLRSKINGEESNIPQPIYTSGEEDGYIRDIFQTQISEVPKIAWLVAPDIIIANEKFRSIHLYSDSNTIQVGKYFRPLTKAEIKRIRKKHTVACDVTASYHQYKLPGKQTPTFGFPDRIFYTSKAFPVPVKVGYKFSELISQEIANIITLAELKKSQFLHKYFIISPVGSNFRYSFHGFYSAETKEAFMKGIILHNEEQVLTGKFWEISEENLCDGCPMPLYRNEYPHQSYPDMTNLFILLNVFSFPEFPYPVVMLDTSTVEGRAISLVTFNHEPKYSEYRLYEYIVECVY